ncbi:guanine nucleotide exchange factor [Tuber indicum]|nr:guanine nucleotide exchange factor [Tuber indicum]
MAAPSSNASKLSQVQALVDMLRTDLQDHHLPPEKRIITLEKLKVFGRDVNQSDPIFTMEGIEMLCKHAFEGTDSKSAQEAMRCLANALLKVPGTRQIFVELGYTGQAVNRYRNDSLDEEFLAGRILFLVTYATAETPKWLEEYKLANYLNDAITRHGKIYSKINKNEQPSALQDMAFTETTKLLFNLTHFAPEKVDLFSRSIPTLFKILCRRKLPSLPLQSSVAHLVNSLLNLDLSSQAGCVFPSFDPTCNVARLIEVLDLSVESPNDNRNNQRNQLFNEAGAPLVTLLRKVFEISSDQAKKYMRIRLLPSDEERKNPRGKDDSLASRLLQLSASAAALNIRQHLASMLFEVSNSNPEEFVRNVGYGYASGLLLSAGVGLPQSALESLSASSDSSGRLFNPITGQALDSEPETKDPFSEMTDEEKEREAERLFILFERLKQTGVVDIQNPVEKALHEGRFEELD